MGMMKTLFIIQRESMAPEGKRKHGIRLNKQAIVFYETKEEATASQAALNKIRPFGTPAYKQCFGPDHPLVRLKLINTYPIWGQSTSSSVRNSS